jgi:CRP-like cAMP-binding protein
MKHIPSLERLRNLPPFHNCTERELRGVDRRSCFRAIPAGTVLCRHGAVGRETFVIVSGEAAVSVDGVHIANLGRGAFVGEMAVLDGDRRTATVVALTSMELLVFTPCELETILAEVPGVARRMLATMSTRLRLANPAPEELAGRVEVTQPRTPHSLQSTGELQR